MRDKRRVLIGMSGGVDSSVAAMLLRDRGYEVIGVTMIMSEEAENPSIDAKKVADFLGIKHIVINCIDEFCRSVKKYFSSEYLNARTPNPCVMCNRTMKWTRLLALADEMDAEYIATGHYARILELENGRYTVRMTRTGDKDQTYALCLLTQEQLKRTLMPIGDYEKSEIRGMAETAGLPVAAKKDSMEICFIPDNDYAAFVETFENCHMPEGDFVDSNGNILGHHKGLLHYTIGQRKGLNLALGYPAFVTGLNTEKNEVVIGTGEDVWTDTLICDQMNYMGTKEIEDGMRFLAKIRYAHAGEYCTVSCLTDTKEGSVSAQAASKRRFICRFDRPIRAVTPGQAVVFYQDGCVMAGGFIES